MEVVITASPYVPGYEAVKVLEIVIGNAVIGFKLDSNELNDSVEIIAYGTAAVIEPEQGMTDQQINE
ncbi:MAG: hypothetical protein TU36_004785 [Vulcanisaeta sp. AZ3]